MSVSSGSHSSLSVEHKALEELTQRKQVFTLLCVNVDTCL